MKLNELMESLGKGDIRNRRISKVVLENIKHKSKTDKIIIEGKTIQELFIKVFNDSPIALFLVNNLLVESIYSLLNEFSKLNNYKVKRDGLRGFYLVEELDLSSLSKEELIRLLTK